MLRVCKRCGAQFDGDSRDINCPPCRRIRDSKFKTHICKSCGREFLSCGPRTYYCAECAAQRKSEASARYKQRKKAGNVREIGSTDICEMCGAPYEVEGGLQKFCRDCQFKKRNEDSLKRYYSCGKEQLKKRVNERVIATQNCIICGKPFYQIGDRLLCCSDECSQIHAQNLKDNWREENREYLLAKNREWWVKNGEERNKKRRTAHSKQNQE